ncbi:cob(I)yrinic acid a,c-diamide adenosyltransferase [Candidatus Albibeggiatoa sp. nov. NOAA]|uniref:cob(I)yrinic acid a,c-diamide adenosyltransferase n=1 Tax=Candidatus Albibeggiatoa sp. nov. NOAA TaxID=3162724 RepID=UPI0032F0F575|nr:cob(I)yrinic acid a,c-diamide adenosyltransferase [Thiotrichaceae bacterium]
MSSITTKRGDEGVTSLIGLRVPKSDARIEACGAIDELGAHLGYARALCKSEEFNQLTKDIQVELYTLGNIIATVPEKETKRKMTPEMIDRLNETAQRLEQREDLFSGWAVSGDELTAAAYDVARTTCRRAERQAVYLKDQGLLTEPLVLVYLNRLSDLLWLVARWIELDAQVNSKLAPFHE